MLSSCTIKFVNFTTICAGYPSAITNLSRIGDGSSKDLTFSWNPLNATDCPTVVYIINATLGCGSCPKHVSANNATCTGVRNGETCTFSVYATICGNKVMSEVMKFMTELPGEESVHYRQITYSLASAPACPLVLPLQGCHISISIH